MGEQSLLIRCGDLLRDRGHSIEGVIADAPQIVEWARENSIPLWSPGTDYAEALQGVDFDYFFSIANLRIVPSSVLEQARRDAINFHDGLLPERAGLYTPAWAVIEQRSQHGVTWHQMTDGVDEGDILSRRLFSISLEDTAFTVNTKCYEAGFASFGNLVKRLGSKTLEPLTQDVSRRTYYPWHKRPDRAGLLEWSEDAATLDALVRGLDFGPTLNPLGTAKARVGTTTVIVGALEVLPAVSTEPAGRIVDVVGDRIILATGTQDVSIGELRDLSGEALDVTALLREHGLDAGKQLPLVDDELGTRLDALQSFAVHHEAYWRAQLRQMEASDVPYVGRANGPADVQVIEGPQEFSGLRSELSPVEDVTAAWVSFLARLLQRGSVSLVLHPPELFEAAEDVASIYASWVPWTVPVDATKPVQEGLASIANSLTSALERGPFARDLIDRTPDLDGFVDGIPASVELFLGDRPEESITLSEGVALGLHVDRKGATRWVYDQNRVSDEDLRRLHSQFEQFVLAAARNPEQPLRNVPIVDDEERQKLVSDWNDTAVSYDATPIHEQFEAQVHRTPDAPALTHGEETVSYRRLDERANQIAHRLVNVGVRPGDRVGVSLDRSTDMVATLLGIHKAGAAYVPLDPTYPDDRLAFMIEDARPTCLVVDSNDRILPDGRTPLLDLTAEGDNLSGLPVTSADTEGDADRVAYVMYTSGSTGTPKGVMVTHQNVANFFAGMDDRIARTSEWPEVWLAVTSISFDISVLELFWTLTRGFRVVLQTDGVPRTPTSIPKRASEDQEASNRALGFSLFYFSSDEKLDGTAEATDKYRLLLDGAEYADAHGFEAVWTPERHFHDFGGLYPNPSVISAAIAARTENVHLRAGSCVSPLHHPVRIAEEWSIVDNLSGGRVGISFAAGWQPNDFVIRPENFANRKALMFDQIEQVRALWRGESLAFDGPSDTPVDVQTLPRPVQAELPVWVTAAGNPDTFEQAGTGGYFLLTHLLGQTADELEEKIGVYRRAWKEAGHEGTGKVTLMLHTFVGEDDEVVREIVRDPMKAYLQSSIQLIKKAAWSFPTFKQKTTDDTGGFQLDGLSPDEIDAVLDHAFERYYETSGLFGSPQRCLDRVADVKAIGVDEIACLLDFGIDAQTVLDHLPYLGEVKERATAHSATSPAPYQGDGVPEPDNPVAPRPSIGAHIQQHDITHLQCTPSQARMLVAEPETRQALGTLQHMMVGGEALPPDLARELKRLVAGRVTNMYGPTETTIWSSTWDIPAAFNHVSIGTPIANTRMYVLDQVRQLVPIGQSGELWIGGDGVTQGYLHRQGLTNERFVDDPFSAGRMYKTGDRAQYASDGTLEFMGRTDFQVKIRGHRVELEEIEAALLRQPGVHAAVVIVRTREQSDQRLIAYVQPTDGASLEPKHLRATIAEGLPEIMVPSSIVVLKALPLTPNGKIDRTALPEPTKERKRNESTPSTASTNATEEIVMAVWQDVLGDVPIEPTENFFDLGGHSLLAVQVARKLGEQLGNDVPIVDLFQYPTVRSLAAQLGNGQSTTGATRGESRADLRRRMFKGR